MLCLASIRLLLHELYTSSNDVLSGGAGDGLSKYSMAEKKYWKISRGVMVIPSESIEFTHEGRRPE